MKRTLTTLLVIAAFLLISATAYAEANRPDKPDRPGKADGERGGIRDGNMDNRPGLADPFLAEPSEAMKVELKRHAESQKAIMTKTMELRKTVFEAVKAEVEKEKARIAEENPDAENPPKPDMKAIFDKLKETYKPQIEEICKATIEENITHAEKVLEIKKAEKEEMIKKMVERFTERRPDMRNGKGDGKGDGNRPDRPRDPKKNGDEPERPPIE